MTQFRALWWMALVFTLFMLWTQWTHFINQQAAGEPVKAQVTASSPMTATDVPTEQVKSSSPAAEAVPTVQSVPTEKRIKVTTDLFQIELDTVGADLRYAALNAYPVSLTDNSAFTLMSDKAPYLLIAQSGFSAATNSVAPTHHDHFQASANTFALADGESTLRVPLVWEKNGVRVEKTYVFTRGSYTIGLETKVTNQGSDVWQASPYQQLVRNKYDPSSSFWLPTYTGGAVYDDVNKFEKIKFDDMQKQAFKREATGGWLAMLQHYFVAAVVPAKDVAMSYYSKALDGGRYVLGAIGQPMVVAAGQQAQNSVQLYVGPKLQNDMIALATGLDLTVDYGMLAFLATPMFWLLDHLNSLVEPLAGAWSWGWAIILVTILLKAVFFKLSEAGYKSMANLRKLTPRLQHLKDNYSHDKILFQQKMMELYKTEKINPLGGCLPILIQIPVFLALYWVLLEAVELRMTPFLWLEDLSHYDPFFILPILMGVTMVVQQRLNPPPTDPMQEKVMKYLPYIFTVFFLFIPSGLVLYWVVNNTLSIWQQWYITRQIEAQEKPPAHHYG